jgi:type II secretory pathway pseudopilin PulG
MRRPIAARSSATAGSGRGCRGRTSGPFGSGARRGTPAGYTLLELVFASALVATVSGIAAPQLGAALDDYRTTGAARYLASRLQQTRMEAVVRSAEVAVQFLDTADGVRYTVYVDGNRNGVRTRDILRGVDWPLGSSERLPDQFAGVDFGTRPGLPPVDSGPAPGGDPIKLGASNLLSFSPNGTSTSGSLYIKGRRDTQYVIRIFGETGKLRVLRFNPSAKDWRPV